MAGDDEILLDLPTTDLVCAFWAGWERREPSPGFVSIVRIGAERFVTAPAALRAGVETADPVGADALAQLLADHVVLRSGEARLAYTDHATFRPRTSDRVVPVDARGELFANLRASSQTDEWNESMSHDDWARVDGIVEEESLAAVAAHQVWDGVIAHVSVFTAARSRSRGLSTEVASVTVQHAIADGLVPQWRVRIGNDASWRVAQKLGFVEAGRQTFVALQRDA